MLPLLGGSRGTDVWTRTGIILPRSERCQMPLLSKKGGGLTLPVPALSERVPSPLGRPERPPEGQVNSHQGCQL